LLSGAGLKRGEGPVVRIFGRLAAGVSLEAAQAELDTIVAAGGTNSSAAVPPGIDIQTLSI